MVGVSGGIAECIVGRCDMLGLYEHVGGWVIGLLWDWPPVARRCRAQSNGLISDQQYGAVCLLRRNAAETRLHADTLQSHFASSHVWYTCHEDAGEHAGLRLHQCFIRLQNHSIHPLRWRPRCSRLLWWTVIGSHMVVWCMMQLHTSRFRDDRPDCIRDMKRIELSGKKQLREWRACLGARINGWHLQ